MNFDLKTGIPLTEEQEEEIQNIKTEFEDIPLFEWRQDPIPGGMEIVYLMADGQFCHSEITPGEPWPFENAAQWVYRSTNGSLPLAWLPRDYTGARMPQTEEPLMQQVTGQDKCRLEIEPDGANGIYFALYAIEPDGGYSLICKSISFTRIHRFGDPILSVMASYLKERARKEGLL